VYGGGSDATSGMGRGHPQGLGVATRLPPMVGGGTRPPTK
jgi:hypothetical protein